jgi:hypothetical protein
MSLTNFPNGMGSFFVDSNSVAKESAYTVVITTDSGKTFTSETDGTIFTLPSIAIGNTVTFVNMAPDGMNTLTVSPAAADGITYAGSSTDNKDIINTKTTSKMGDSITLASLNGTVAWQVVAVRGTWAKES